MSKLQGWQSKKAPIAVTLALACTLVLYPFFASAYLLTMLITALHFVYLAQSWNLIFGYCGQLALGHGMFYGIAGYISAKLLLQANVSPYLGGG